MRLVDGVRRLQLGIAMAALVVMMLATVADVFMRYAFSQPIRGTYAMTEACLCVFVFQGISMTFVGRRNVVIDLIDAALPPVVLRGLIRLSDILSVAVLLLVGWTMFEPAAQAFAYGDRKPELGLPLSYLWVAALIGMAGTIVSAASPLATPARAEDGHDAR